MTSVRGVAEEPETLITTGVPGLRGVALEVTKVGAPKGTAMEDNVAESRLDEVIRGSVEYAAYFRVTLGLNWACAGAKGPA